MFDHPLILQVSVSEGVIARRRSVRDVKNN